MARTPTPEEALERARRSQDDRLEAIRVLAEARHAVAAAIASRDDQIAAVERETRSVIAAAAAADTKAWTTATAAGWSKDELRKIGFDAPTKADARPRTRRPRASATTTGGATDQATQVDAE